MTAYGIAEMLGIVASPIHAALVASTVAALAAGFALWASVSEGRSTRSSSTRDLMLLAGAAAVGAASYVLLAPLLLQIGRAGPELTLAGGAFLVGYLRRFGLTGTGIGSQIYIGQLLAYGAHLRVPDLQPIILAGLIAALAAIVPRILSGPAEHPQPFVRPQPAPGPLSRELTMGLQAATAALIIVAINATVGLQESAWAITACTYVIAGTPAATIDRVKRRTLGTVVGVPLGLACLPLADAAAPLLWSAAALAMMIYAMALPDRYDIACGAYAFTLIVTLAVAGEHSLVLLAARAWETVLGGALGLAAALLIFPIREAPGDPRSPSSGVPPGDDPP